MRLWMLTKPGFPAIAAKHDRLFASWEFVENRDLFDRPYRWMIRQMAERGLDSRGQPPFWAWHSFGAPGRRVDLRVYYQFEPSLRLTLDVPDELVLLSDETDWHAVLNDWYLSNSESEDDRINKLEAAGQLTQSMKHSSWQRIFDLTQRGDSEWTGLAEERLVQACLPWFEHRWIKDIERFEGRSQNHE